MVITPLNIDMNVAAVIKYLSIGTYLHCKSTRDIANNYYGMQNIFTCPSGLNVYCMPSTAQHVTIYLAMGIGTIGYSILV